MVRINNSDTIREIVKAGKLVGTSIPTELNMSVVPVVEVNPALLRRCKSIYSGVCTNATSATVATLDSDKDFYLVSCSIQFIKDATATATLFNLLVQPYGSNSGAAPLSVPGITLTANSGGLSVSFPFPIRLSRGSTLRISSDTNVGNFKVAACFVGYYDEVKD